MTTEEPMAKLEIKKGPDDEVTAGGLRVVACRREVGTIDGGISVYVWGQEAGQDVELVRMDLFRTRPHYHAPAERQEETVIPAADSVAWGIEALTTRASELAGEAGFAEVGEALDTEALGAAGPLLLDLFGRLEEPNEVSYFEIPQFVLDELAAG